MYAIFASISSIHSFPQSLAVVYDFGFSAVVANMVSCRRSSNGWRRAQNWRNEWALLKSVSLDWNADQIDFVQWICKLFQLFRFIFQQFSTLKIDLWSKILICQLPVCSCFEKSVCYKIEWVHLKQIKVGKLFIFTTYSVTIAILHRISPWFARLWWLFC